MRLVINVCFGGFSLSVAGIRRYAEIKGITLYPFRGKIHIEAQRHMPIEKAFYIHWSTVPVAEDAEETSDDAYWSDRSIPRGDPALVQVVEEMGVKADGEFAELKIVTIPDGIEWEIDEYDGNERIAETHRTWS